MRRWKAGLAWVLALLPLAAAAQDRVVTVVVPYPPGGFVDNVARALVKPLAASLRQPVVVSNRPGANGDLGHAFVANAAPDGRTLLLAAPSLAAQPAIDALFGRRPAYALDSLVPVAQITSDPAVFMVHPSLGVRTLADYVALAKARPAAVSVASSGTYGATHLPVAMLEMKTGIHVLHVPTSGGAQALTMTLGGHTNGVAAAPSVAHAHLQSGRLVALGQTGARRVPSLPQVPTFKESGIDLDYSLWTALFMPRGTATADIERLQQAVRTAVQDEAFKAALEAGQSTLAYEDGAPFARLWRGEVDKLQATVRHIGRVEETK